LFCLPSSSSKQPKTPSSLSLSLCTVCVCVYEREEEGGEGERKGKKILFLSLYSSKSTTDTQLFSMQQSFWLLLKMHFIFFSSLLSLTVATTKKRASLHVRTRTGVIRSLVSLSLSFTFLSSSYFSPCAFSTITSSLVVALFCVRTSCRSVGRSVRVCL